VTYRLSIANDGASYALTPFALSDKGGKRAVLHVYEAASDVKDVLLGMQAIVFVGLREDSIKVEHLFNVFNVGPVSWVPAGETIAPPEGFKACNTPDSMADARFEEVTGKGAELRGTFKPGQQQLTFRYQVPFSGSEKQTIRIEMPPHVAQARVIAEA